MGETRCAAARRPALGLPLLAVAICALVLPAPSAAQVDVTTYKNVTRILNYLATSWMGAGYDDTGDALYLFRPGKETSGPCTHPAWLARDEGACQRAITPLVSVLAYVHNASFVFLSQYELSRCLFACCLCSMVQM